MDKRMRQLPGFRVVMSGLGALGSMHALTVVAQAWLLARAIALLFDGQGIPAAMPYLYGFALVFVLRHTTVWLERRMAGKYAEQQCEDLRQTLLQRVFADRSQVEGSGSVITLAMEGVEKFRTYVELSLPRMIDMALVTLAVGLAVGLTDFWSGIILLVALPLLIAFFILLGLAANKAADRQWLSYRLLARHFLDSLRGLETLRYLGRSRQHAASVEASADGYRRSTMRTLRIAFLSSLSLDFFSMLAIAFVAVSLGVRLIDGTMGFEAALFVLLLAPEYFLPVRQLGTDYHASLDGKEAWTTIQTLIEQPVAPAPIVSASNVDAAKARLVLEQLLIEGQESRTLLSGLDAVLHASDQRIGIVGPSGAGKTTLLHVLSGLQQPDGGSWKIDGLAPEQANWMRHTAYIPQQPYLFAMSLLDNIRFYEPNADRQAVMAVLEQVGLRELVDQMPNGLDERVGEGGRTLSGGQAQRVALARTLVAQRSVLLLDEPTAHLDVETEWEIKQLWQANWSGKRIFLATHRLHWMKEMDVIWVLDHGKLVQQGTHEELASVPGLYRRMLEAAGIVGGIKDGESAEH